MSRCLISCLFLFFANLASVIVFASESEQDEALPAGIRLVSQLLGVHSYDSALTRMNEVENQTHPKFLLLRALQYEMGIGVEIDQDIALLYANKAAEQEDWEAAQYLAWRAISNQEFHPDLKVAMKWRDKMDTWKKENPSPRVIPTTLLYPERNNYLPLYHSVSQWNYAKARENDPVAQYNMFVIFFEGRGTQTDMTRAIHWLMRAANARNGTAANALSLVYSMGVITKENPELALKYTKIAAAAGFAESQLDLAMHLMYESDEEQDLEEGLSWLRKAASLRNQRAMYEIASIAVYGEGVDKDPEEGIRLFEKAVENGDPMSALRLAKIYLNGSNVEQDFSAAKLWADKSIALGNDYGHYVLGRIYQEGLLGEVNLKEAFNQYELAANAGDPLSQEALGRMLMLGQGNVRNLEEAYSWFRLSAKQGNLHAREMHLMMEGLGWGTQQNPESMVLAIESKRGKPMSEQKMKELIQQLLSSPESEPFFEQRFQVKDVRFGTEAEDFESDQMTPQQRGLFYKLYASVLEEMKNKTPILNPFESPELKKILQKSWEKELNKAISETGTTDSTRIPQMWLGPPPDYPELLLDFGINEDVTVTLHIDKDGYIIEHKIEKKTLAQFKHAVEAVIPQWRFIPSIENGKPVSSWVKITFPFTISRSEGTQDAK